MASDEQLIERIATGDERALRRPEAELDLFLIWEHISLDNPDAADRILDQFEAEFDLMATHPLMGRERPELVPQLRSFAYGRYVIFYLPLALVR